MAFYRKSGGGNVVPTNVRRRSAGTWVDVQSIKRRSAGTWITAWQNISFSLPSSVDATAPKSGLSATATLTLGSSGTYSGTKSGTWVTPTSQAAGLDVYVTYTGAYMTGTFNTWLAMSTSRTWGLTSDPGTYGNATMTFQFRKSGTTQVINTSTVGISADAIA